MEGKPKRWLELDALRALSILGMLWSGLLPMGVLPRWMYHIQVPPPDHRFDSSFIGISWVDVVFPVFIFCMGVSIPLAFQKRLSEQTPKKTIFVYIAKRYFRLVLFAWIVGVAKAVPYAASSLVDSTSFFYKADVYGISLLSGISLFLLFGSLSFFQDRLQKIARIVALVLLLTIAYSLHKYFAFEITSWRTDIIILILANVYLIGAVLWLFIQHKYVQQLGAFIAFGLIQIALKKFELESILTQMNPLNALMQPFMLHYLLLLTPAMTVGYLLLNDGVGDTSSVSPFRNLIGLSSYLGSVLIALILFYQNASVLFIWFAMIPMAATISNKKEEANARFNPRILSIILWTLACILEHFWPEGGIKKDPPTAAYLLATGALSIWLLYAFIHLYALLKKIYPKQNKVDWFMQNGRNPLLAYVSVALFVLPVMHLSKLNVIYQAVDSQESPWLAAFTSLLLTLFAMFMVGKLSPKGGQLKA